MPGFKDITGLRSGKLVAIRPQENRSGSWYWYCECDCGGKDVGPGFTIVKISRLTSQHTKSCGCLREQHGATGSAIHRVWCSMLQRCYDSNCKSYKNYGGRGIKICEPWRLSLAKFSADIIREIGECPSPKHELDRINNDGDYEPGNMRWATKNQQWEHRQLYLYQSRIGILKAVVQAETPISPDQIAIASKVTRTNVYRVLPTLLRHGLVKRLGLGKYEATQRGRAAHEYNYSIDYIAHVWDDGDNS